MKIFIGSAKESIDTMDWIAMRLEEYGHKALRWDTPGLFPPGRQTYERLIEISHEVDGAIFIFSEDDKVWYRGGSVPQPRDNVLVEYGLFSGKLNPKRAIICTIGKPKISADLLGITYIDASENRRQRANLEIKEWLNSIKTETDVERLISTEAKLRYFRQSDHEKFTICLRDLIFKAKRIVMTGCGLATLGHPPFVKDIMARASQGKCHIEIYMANPFSPAVEVRLIEEEIGAIKPPDGKQGLISRLKMLLHSWQSAGRPKTVSIRLSTHYPTFALIIIDNEYFVYPYSYAMLGNFSPVIRFSRDFPAQIDVINFLEDHYNRIKSDALDADKVINALENKFGDMNDMHTLAVFYIPPEDSALYKFGTCVLGYDVRRERAIDTPWAKYIGRARDYGFHLTVCNVLYFINMAEIRKAVAEIEFISTDFTNFHLTGLEINPDFPNKTSLAIKLKDPSGQLEALHHEFVHRVYRRAVASDYSLGLASLDRSVPDQRCELIMKRYHAPYILKWFVPHFTLANKVPESEKDKVYKELGILFDKQVPNRTIKLENLAIMSRSSVDFKWKIEKEISLG